MRIQRNLSLIGFLLILFFSKSIDTQAYISDPSGDVSIKEADIVGITVTGKQVTIEHHTSIYNDPYNALYYMVLFSDDGNYNTWEAAIMLIIKDGTTFLHRIVGDVHAPAKNWITEVGGSRATVQHSSVSMSFTEYTNVGSAQIIALAISESGVVEHDWAPNNFKNSPHFSGFEIFMDGISTKNSDGTSGGGSGSTSTATTTTITTSSNTSTLSDTSTKSTTTSTATTTSATSKPTSTLTDTSTKSTTTSTQTTNLSTTSTKITDNSTITKDNGTTSSDTPSRPTSGSTSTANPLNFNSIVGFTGLGLLVILSKKK